MEYLRSKHKIFLLRSLEIAASVVLALVLTTSLHHPLTAQAQAGSNAGALTGDAWSENIGWVSFSGSNYGVFVSPTDGTTLTGYAWSENIGWVSFTSSDLSGCPSGICSARLVGTKPNVSLAGWARVCSATVNGDCTGATRVGGWDGWISLSGASPAYGPAVSTYAPSPFSGGILSGYAWGSDVVGWLQSDSAFGGVNLYLTQCNDGLDNDKDGTTDLADSDCAGDITTDSEGSRVAQGTVDIKANAKDTLSVRSDTSVSITWTTASVGGCTLQSPSGTNPVGSQNIPGTAFTIAVVTKFTLTCNDLVGGNPTGPAVSDSVTVRLIPAYKEI